MLQGGVVPADALVEGAWVARWGAWEIRVHGRPGWWVVSVVDQDRAQIGKRNVFAAPTAAVGWACTVLRDHGAVVLIDGRKHQLEAFLAFEPAVR